MLTKKPYMQNQAPIVFNCVYSRVKGGVEQMFINYTLALSKKYTVICIIPQDFKYLETLVFNNIQYETIKIRNFYDIISAIKFTKLYEKYNPTFVFSHNGRFNSTINISRHLSKIKNTIAICHGDTKRLEKFSAILAVNSNLEKILIKKKINNVSLLPNFIEIIKTEHPTKNSNGVFSFGVISRLSPEKSVIDSIKAIEELPQTRNIKYKLIIAGDGIDLETLKNYVQQQSLQEIVNFVGWMSDKGQFYKSIDCLVLTSLFETFGLTVLEAFNYSLPVISSRTDGPSEIIEDGVNGFLFEPCNIEQLVALMLKVSRNQNLAAKAGANGLITLHQKYSKIGFEDKLFYFLSELSEKSNI